MMDSNYLIQRKINAKRQFRRKVTLAITLLVVFLGLITIGLVMVLMDDGETNTGTTGKQNQTSGKVTPGAEGNNGSAESEPSLTPTATPTPTATVAPTPVPVTKIAIDPGHGGWDKGSNRGEYYEKDANLAIALFVRDYLEEAGYEVYMLRDSDVGIDLENRPGLAIEQNVDLYVSIHINSFTEDDDDNTQGSEVYYSDKRNDDSDVLAQYVADEMAKMTGARNRGIKLSNNLVVVRESKVPACLVECGFISSPTEREKLFSTEYQKLLGEGIANGIMKFIPAEKEVEEPAPEADTAVDGE